MFKKHSIEEMRKSSKMSKERKRLARKRVESVAHTSMNEREVNKELQTLKKGQSNKATAPKRTDNS